MRPIYAAPFFLLLLAAAVATSTNTTTSTNTNTTTDVEELRRKLAAQAAEIDDLRRKLASLQAFTGVTDVRRAPWSDVDRRNAIRAMTQFPSQRSIDGATNRQLSEGDERCIAMQGHHHIAGISRNMVREGQRSVKVHDKCLSYTDVNVAYEKLFDRRGMHSTTTFMGVALQQFPADAFAIGDLLWRVRPRLLIELGTSGGGSALYWARLMLGYDPHARVITIDPFLGPKGLDGSVLEDWNRAQIRQFCPQCSAAATHAIWQRAVTFIHAHPRTNSTLATVRAAVAEVAALGLPVLVVEDSNHVLESVTTNLNLYAGFVSPGSYFIVQDTRGGLFRGPTNALHTFLERQNYTTAQLASLNTTTATTTATTTSRHRGPAVGPADFAASRPSGDNGTAADVGWLTQEPVYVRDRRPEYYILTQHAGGYLRRLEKGETLVPFYDEVVGHT